MNLHYRLSWQLFLMLLLTTAFSRNVQAQTCQSCPAQQLVTYNEFTGSFTALGATQVSLGQFGATTPLGTALSSCGPTVALPGTGNFLGVGDGFMAFSNAAGNVEIFNGLNGVGGGTSIYNTLLPTNGTTASVFDEPHSGELVRANGTWNDPGNGKFIDIANGDLVYKDADGSLSSYNNSFLSGTCPNGGQGYGSTDPTWTTFTGGPMNGQAPTQANILCIENQFIFTLGAAGDNNYHAYVYSTGAYFSLGNFFAPTFSGGPLNGATPRAALTNTVPGITFLGMTLSLGAGTYLAFHQASPKKLIFYEYSTLAVDVFGLGATAFSDNIAGDPYIMDHTNVDDVLGPDFMGVGSNGLALVQILDATGHLEYYYANGGVAYYESDMSMLRGPQGGRPIGVGNPNFIDVLDNGYVYLDADNTLSWYNNVTNLVYHDANWRTYTGGPLNGQAPSKANIIAAEDGGVYVVQPDGSLFYYQICDGKPFPGADLLTATTLTGGPLAGKDLSDAVQNLVPGVSFLGISNDEMVFTVCLKPEVETTKRVVAAIPNANGVTTNVTYEVRIANVGPVDIDRIQIFDSVAAQLGTTFVRVIPGSMIGAQWGGTFSSVNPGFNGTTDIRVLNPASSAAILPTNFLYNTISVWYTVEVDPTSGGNCTPTPTPGYLLNQARGFAVRAGATGTLTASDVDQDFSDDGVWDSADRFPAIPQPPFAPTAFDLYYLENQPWPGNTLPANVLGNQVVTRRDDPTPLRFPNVNTTKALISSMVDPADPNYALAEFEIMMTNTGTTDLTNIVLTDNLTANMGCAFVNVATAPAFVATTNAMTNPTLSAFTGTGAGINIFNGTTGVLKPCQKVTVRFTVRLNPNCGAVLGNTAMGGATGESCAPTALPAAGPLAGGVPFTPTTTPICAPAVVAPKASRPAPGAPVGPNGELVINVPLMSTVKSAVSAVAQVDPAVPGTVHLTLRFGIKNTGNVPLTNLGIIDPLATQFGCAFLNVVSAPTIFSSTAATAPTVNAAYNGSGNLLNGTTGNLLPNQEVFVEVVVAVNPNCVGAPMPQTNSATGQATGNGATGAPVMITDVSDAGSTFESNNGNTSQNDPNILNMPLIGAAKAVVNVVPATAAFPQGHVFATFELTVINRGNVPLTNLTLADAVGAQLGCAYLGIAPGGAPAITASTAATNPSLMASFTGLGANTALFNGTTGNLMPNQTVTIRFTGVMDPNCNDCGNTVITNQTTAGGSGTGILGATVVVTDLSDSGLGAESFNVGEPGDSPSNSNNPTPVYLPSVMSAMSMEGFECPYDNKCNANSLVQMRIRVKNTGNTTLSAVQVNQALAANLGSAFVRVMPGTLSYLPSLSTSVLLPPVVNPAYNGTGNMFTSMARLAPCQELVIGYVVEVNPNAAGAANNLTTQATITATSDVSNNAGTVAVTDLTDAGRVTESDNAAFGAGYDSPTNLNLPRITTNPAPLTVNACDNWESAIQTWLNAAAGGILANGANTITCIVNDYFDNTATPGWVNTGCGLNQYRDVRFKAKYTDAWGNMSELCWCARVTIQDNQPPSFDMQPMNKAVDCAASGAVATVQLWLSEAGGAWAHACGSDITWTNNYSGSLPACNTPRTVVFTATDGCNRSATASATLTVTDATAPTITNVPANTTITCPAVPSFGAPTANDGCGAATMTFTDAGSATCPAGGTITRTWRATDACGNSRTASATITVLPLPAPSTVSISCPANITMAAPAGATGMVVNYTAATGSVTNCAASSAATVTLLSGPASGANFPVGVTTVCYRATNACGNSTSCCFTVTVTATQPPASVVSINCPANISLTATTGATTAVATFANATASSTCTAGSAVTVSQISGPASGSAFPVGATQVCFRATDACGASTSCCFTVTVTGSTVNPPANAVTVNCPANMTMTAPMGATGMAVSFAAPSATTTCTQTGTISTTQIAGPASGANFPVGTTQVCFRATDACGNSNSCCFNVTVTASNAPGATILNASAPAPQNISCGGSMNWASPVTSTTCSGGVVSMTSADSQTGSACIGITHTRTWTATDACGNVKSVSSTITQSPDNVAPTFASLPPLDQMINCGTALPIGTATATDNCASATTSYTVANNGASACNTVNGITYGFDSYITWTATDGCGNTATALRNIWVLPGTNIAFLSKPADKQITCSEAPVFEQPMPKSFIADIVDITYVDNAQLDACGAGTVTRTWTAVDAQGNTCKAEQTITMMPDTEKPAISLPVSTVSADCQGNVPVVTPIVSDNCTNNSDLVVTHTDVNYGSSIERTYTVADACGNINAAMLTIALTDVQAPVFATIATQKSVTCDAPVVFDQPTVQDNCAVASLTHVDQVQIGACTNTHVRTWTAIDAAGNSATIKQTVLVTDTQAPVFAGVLTAKTVACADDVQFDTPVATDLCHTVSMYFNNASTTPVCGNSGYSITRTWTANDGCNNLAQVEQTITVAEDTEVPVIVSNTSVQLEATMAQIATWTPAQLVVSDNCGTPTVTTQVNQVDQCNYVVTYTVTDACANVTTAQQALKIVDGPCVVSGTEDLQFIGMKLYPNPTVSSLTLELPSSVELQDLRYGIYDVYGRLTLESTVTGYNTVINVQTLSQGAYFLKLSNENASVVKGFVKIAD